MATTAKASKAGECFECKEPYAVGEEISFRKGSRKDGSTFNAPVHARHNTPPAAVSSGQAGSRPGGTVPPAVDQPIYTFHIVEKYDAQGIFAGREVYSGVSRKGQPVSQLDTLSVADQARNGGH